MVEDAAICQQFSEPHMSVDDNAELHVPPTMFCVFSRDANTASLQTILRSVCYHSGTARFLVQSSTAELILFVHISHL